MAAAEDLKSFVLTDVWVRVPLAPTFKSALIGAFLFGVYDA